MLQWEHSAIHSTFIKLSFVNKIFVLSIFEWLLKTGFTVFPNLCYKEVCYKGTELYIQTLRISAQDMVAQTQNNHSQNIILTNYPE